MPDIESYDPEQAPDATDWLSLGEWDRIALIAEAHERLGVKVPNLQAHATMHCIVENQLAANAPPATRQAFDRLIARGRSRHDALHDVAEVLARHMQAILTTGKDHVAADLDRELGRLGR